MPCPYGWGLMPVAGTAMPCPYGGFSVNLERVVTSQFAQPAVHPVARLRLRGGRAVLRHDLRVSRPLSVWTVRQWANRDISGWANG